MNSHAAVFRVGLETHVHLSTKEKLFCGCLANQACCVICKAEPGTIPSKINQEALKKAALLVDKLQGTVTKQLVFYRKHYNYYDLPAGFQRSQHPQSPFSTGGYIRDLSGRITALSNTYLEEDPAAVAGDTLDYHRIGTPLLEIVTEPCFVGPINQIVKEVLAYLRTLSRLAIDLKVCQPQKVMKTDVNISVDGKSFRYELKNITSLTDVKNALLGAANLLVSPGARQENYTYSYKNTLKASRPKSKYLFLKDYNIPAVPMGAYLNTNETHYTLYDLTTHVGAYFTAHQLPTNGAFYYAFLKLLTTVLNKTQNKASLLTHLDQLQPKKAYFHLKQKDKSTQTCALDTHLINWFANKKFTGLQFKQKERAYLLQLNQLKKELSATQIPYNSQLLNQKIQALILSEPL